MDASINISMEPLIALLHALRLIYGWNVTIGGWAVPVWVSAVAFSSGDVSPFKGSS